MTEPFNFPDGRVANNAKDLLELCEQYPDEATGYLVRQDLEKWLAYIGSYDVAECAANARQVDTGDRQKLEDFLSRCHSLNEPKPVPAAVPETNIADNMTPPESGEPITETPPKWTESAALNTEGTSADTAPTTPNLDAAIPPKQPESVEAATANKSSAETVTAPTEQPSKETAPASAKSKAKVETDANSTSEEKPSFFQVVAKFIVKILYRDKA